MTAPTTNSRGNRIWGTLASRPAANRTTTGTSKAAPLGTEFIAVDRLYSAVLVRDAAASTPTAMWMPTNAGSAGIAGTPGAGTPGAGASTGPVTATAGTAVQNKACINAAGTINLLALTTTDQPNYGIALSTTMWIKQGVGNIIGAAAALTSGTYGMTDGNGLVTNFAAGGGALRQFLILGDQLVAGGQLVPCLLYRDAIL